MKIKEKILRKIDLMIEREKEFCSRVRSSSGKAKYKNTAVKLGLLFEYVEGL